MKQETEERKRQRFKRQIAGKDSEARDRIKKETDSQRQIDGKDSEARDRRKTENQETNRRKRQ